MFSGQKNKLKKIWLEVLGGSNCKQSKQLKWLETLIPLNEFVHPLLMEYKLTLLAYQLQWRFQL